MRKRTPPKREFERSPHATLSPTSADHPSNPWYLRRQPKPTITPVLRPIFHPAPAVYPAPFRGRP